MSDDAARQGSTPSSLVDRREVQRLLLLAAALRTGLIDALQPAEGVTAAAAAAAAGTDPRATAIVLEGLSALGVLETRGEEEARVYRLTAEARRHLLEPGPDYERYSLLHQVSILRGWLELPSILEHGHPPAREGRRDLRSFVRTMAEGDPAAIEEVVERSLAYAAPRTVRRVLDAGGAVGHVARAFREAGVDAVLLCDAPEVLEEARAYQGELAGELEYAACDFLEALPPGPFDVIYLGNVYHIYGPAENAALTRRVFEALAPGGVIAVRDFVLGRSPRAPLFAVNMLQATDKGGVWTEKMFREWFQGAGFVGTQVIDLQRSWSQLVLGRRPG